MKNYLKHLKNNPSKIVWLGFVYIIVFAIAVILYLNKNQIIEDNNIAIYSLLWVLVVTIFLTANYQPYKEYKDGL